MAKRKKKKRKSKKTRKTIRKRSKKTFRSRKKSRKVKKTRKSKARKKSRKAKPRKINFKAPKLLEDGDGKSLIKVSDSWANHAYVNESKYKKKLWKKFVTSLILISRGKEKIRKVHIR